MRATPGLVFFGLALAALGMTYSHSFGQTPDPFTMQQLGGGPPQQRANPGIDCGGEFNKHNAEMQKRGMAIQAASKRKATAKEACGLLRSYVSAESGLIAFLKKYTGPCGIPPEILKQVVQVSEKSGAMRDQVCKAAANQAAAPPPPPPSQGLSGAIGSGSGGATNNPGGSGVFDSLTGNVLRQ